MLSFTSVTVCSSDPNSWWVLLLYVRVVILARATSEPQTTATILTGSSEDPCSSWSPEVPTKRYPALDVTWPEDEVPLSKEQVSWEPKKIVCQRQAVNTAFRGWVDSGVEHLPTAKKHQSGQLLPFYYPAPKMVSILENSEAYRTSQALAARYSRAWLLSRASLPSGHLRGPEPTSTDSLGLASSCRHWALFEKRSQESGHRSG